MRDGPVVLGIIHALGRKNLDGFQTMCQSDRSGGRKYLRQAAVQTKPSDFCAVAVVVVGQPIRIHRGFWGLGFWGQIP